ncbi:MAG: NAD-dependent epimerase/dehydratase family protein [Acidobacteriota bacterium]|nr:NAD-dependent epimerase/dehydratase family protein [Acidobacteriota bacterium]
MRLQKTLVIGGTLFIGRLLLAELLKAGHEVSVLHRKPNHDLGPEVENLQADRNDAESLRTALAGRRFDAVFDNVYDWERGTASRHVEATVDAIVESCGAGLSRYIFISSVAAYGGGLGHKEDDPLAPDSHPDAYVRNKAMSERALFRRHQESGLPVVTFRPPYIYGPGNPFYREAFFWDRMHAGRPIVIPGEGDWLMQFVLVDDLVAAAVASLTEPGAVGQAFNIGNDSPVTQLALVKLFAKVAGVDPKLVRIPRKRIIEAGGNPMGKPAYFGVYFDMLPITEAMGKAERVLKVAMTPFEKGLEQTHAWYLDHGNRAPMDTSFEDFLLARQITE